VIPAQTTEVPAYLLDQWIARMADGTNGFNPSLAVLLNPDDQYSINFGYGTQNFFRGNVGSVEQLLQSSAVTLPLMTLDIVRGSDARSQQYIKFMKFAGVLIGICQVFIGFGQMGAVNDSGTLDFSTIPHATVSALYQTMNSLSLEQPVVYPNGIIYNGDLDFQITPAMYGASGWVRVVTAQCTFRYSTET